MKYKRSLLLMTVATTIVFTGCGAQVQEASVTEEPGVAVETELSKIGEIETVYEYSGKANPVEYATVYSTVSGIVEKEYFEIGDYVNEGEILFEVDTEMQEASLQGLLASKEAAQAGITSAQISLDTVNGAQTQLQVDNARVSYENAKTAYENAQIMYNQGFVSDDDLKRAKDSYEQAELNYELTSTTLIEENTARAQAGLDSAVAQSESVEAQITSTRKTINDAKVESPISGIVTGKNVMEGVLLSSQSAPYTISDMSKMIVEVGVSEQVINSIEVGEEVKVEIATVYDEPITGVVKTVNPGASQEGTYAVEVEIDNANGDIKGGMFAKIEFTKEKGTDNLLVDRDSIIEKNGEIYVFVAENNLAVKKNVELGIDNGEMVQIISGLSENEEVIIKGQTFLDDGDKLNIVSKENEEAQTPEKTEQEKGE